MAYINKETKKTILDALKKEFPKLKFSAGVRHYSNLVIKVYDDALLEAYTATVAERYKHDRDYLKEYGQDVNEYADNGETLNAIIATIKKAGKWYDKTDTMTDYFNTAFYIDLKLFPSKGISLALCNTL